MAPSHHHHTSTPKSTLPHYLNLHTLHIPANLPKSLALYRDVASRLMAREELHGALFCFLGHAEAKNSADNASNTPKMLHSHAYKMGAINVRQVRPMHEMPCGKLLSKRRTQESSVIKDTDGRYAEIITDIGKMTLNDDERREVDRIIQERYPMMQQMYYGAPGMAHGAMMSSQGYMGTQGFTQVPILSQQQQQSHQVTVIHDNEDSTTDRIGNLLKKPKKKKKGRTFKVPRMVGTSQDEDDMLDDDAPPKTDFVSASSLKMSHNGNNAGAGNKRKREGDYGGCRPSSTGRPSFDPASSLRATSNRYSAPSSGETSPTSSSSGAGSAPPRKRPKKFINPVEKKQMDEKKKLEEEKKKNRPGSDLGLFDANGELPKELQGLEEALVERIALEVIESKVTITWDDIGGLEYAKQAVEEAVIWPLQQPELFSSELLQGTRGILMFGPPGTGKTLIAKAIASQGAANFFSISASSLMSKWLGEGEQLVKTLFKVAAFLKPSIIFLDEIDALLAKRGQGDDAGGARRLKTEFLVQLDGAGSDSDGVVIICATNLPWEIDDAVLRRMRQKIYVPLPEASARLQIVKSHARKGGPIQFHLSDDDFNKLAEMTDGYSGSDLKKLSQQAMMIVIREIKRNKDESGRRGVMFSDYVSALREIRPSVDNTLLDQFVEWDKKFGSNAD